MFKKLCLLSGLCLFAANAFGFAGEFQNEDLIPSVITDVKIKIFNYANTPGGQEDCGDTQCYRADIFLNDLHVARWAVSPGRPHPGTDFKGNFSPIYNGRSLHPSHLYGRGYLSGKRRDSMPYAMFLRLTNGGKSPIALHCGHVTGRRESHGCIRMVCDGQQSDAYVLSSWVKEAFRNGGRARVWTQDVYPSNDPR